jgi:hypothetical protein
MSDVAASPLREHTALVVSRLHALRRQIAAWFWVEGLSRVLWTALAVFVIDLGIDWFFRMDVPQRAVMLLIMAGAIGAVAWRRLARPLSTSLSDDALALQVEDRNKLLGQGMISALQLARIEDHAQRGMSPAMVRQTVISGAQAAAGVDFGRVLDRREFRINATILLAAVLLLVGGAVGVARSAPLGIWFNRNLLLGDKVWPQKTYLVVKRAEKGKVKFPRGEDWTQVVEVTPESEVVPESVFIDFRRTRARNSQAMKKSGERSFEAVFSNVIEPFEFRARGGDAFTPWIRVELVEQPAVEELRLEITPPKYTGEEKRNWPRKGPYFVLRDQPGAIGHGKQAAGAGRTGDRRQTAAAGTGARAKNFSGTVSPTQLMAGQYVIELEDTEGLTSRRPTTFGLRLRADREPRVRAKLVGVSGMVVPQAHVPLECRATDDYAVKSLEVSYVWRDEMTQEPTQGKVELPAAKEGLGTRELAFSDVIDLSALKLPTGTSLNFHIAASDNDDVTGPNVGKSSDFLLRIVSEEELRTDLLRREKEQRQELERLLKQQEDLLTDGQALQAGLTDAALAGEQKDQLMQYQRRQKVIGTNVGAIAERLTGIVTEVLNNRLEDPSGRLEKRLREDIIQPLTEIAELAVPDAVQHLDRTRRQAAEIAPRTEALETAVTRQKEIAGAMREILKHMVKAEGYQEAVNLLYEIQKTQQDVYDRTVKEKQERIKGIIEGRSEEKKEEQKPE